MVQARGGPHGLIHRLAGWRSKAANLQWRCFGGMRIFAISRELLSFILETKVSGCGAKGRP
jgi:hypothetical protein